MTREDFLGRIDEIMCGTSNAERAYLADLYDEVTAPHWISVEDELPEVCVAVLTTTPHGTQRVGFYEDGWWLANTTDLVRMGSITHWMPIPSVEHLKDKEL